MDDTNAPQNPALKRTGAAFPVTRWSLIAGLAEGSEVARRRALEELYQTYWFPLYAFARHHFQQQWVLSLLGKARERVAAQYSVGEKAQLIEPAITDPEAINYASAEQ